MRTIARNSVFNGAAKVFSKFVSLIISMIMARTNGINATDQFAIAVTYAGVIYVFLNFGIFSIVQREIAKDESSATGLLSNALGMTPCISVLASLLLGLGIRILPHLNTGIELMIFACLYTGLSGIFSLITNALEGINHFDDECKAIVAYNIASLILAIPALVAAACTTLATELIVTVIDVLAILK